MSDFLISCTFDGEVFRPQTPFQLRRVQERFGAGEIVLLTPEEERSAKSHRHYFATIKEMWQTLPESCAMEQWAQSPDHLRRYSLIRTGYSDTLTFPCATASEARRWAANMRPVDEFSIVVAQGSTVVRYTAKSQAMRAMGSKAFQASKDAVLTFLHGLLETGGRHDAA